MIATRQEVKSVLDEQQKKERSRVTRWSQYEIAVVSRMLRSEIRYHQGVIQRRATVREIELCRQKINSLQRILLSLANSSKEN